MQPGLVGLGQGLGLPAGSIPISTFRGKPGLTDHGLSPEATDQDGKGGRAPGWAVQQWYHMPGCGLPKDLMLFRALCCCSVYC